MLMAAKFRLSILAFRYFLVGILMIPGEDL